MHSHRHEAQPCPWCGAHLDAATNAGPESGAPEPGDTSVCLHCAMPLIFTDQHKWRNLLQREINALHPLTRKQLTDAMRVVREAPAELREKRHGKMGG